MTPKTSIFGLIAAALTLAAAFPDAARAHQCTSSVGGKFKGDITYEERSLSDDFDEKKGSEIVGAYTTPEWFWVRNTSNYEMDDVKVFLYCGDSEDSNSEEYIGDVKRGKNVKKNHFAKFLVPWTKNCKFKVEWRWYGGSRSYQNRWISIDTTSYTNLGVNNGLIIRRHGSDKTDKLYSCG
ncbi:hypothetical protein [Pseudoruegeria sp. HB172150]|uniref:hypothetical protein n=1 Tax=Pseudoruegeria sp. HB172150 TaxID=2721164 RepID=UPI001554CFAA|nr:hypothetical protein [Pseudoruegeria sp. HB172150]